MGQRIQRLLTLGGIPGTVPGVGSPPAVAIGQLIPWSVRLSLAELANAQEYQFKPYFAGRFLALNASVVVAATTAAKLATITARVNAGAVGGGGVLALTSANMTPIGAIVDATAITGANTFAAGQTFGWTVSAVTAFVEGAAVITALLEVTGPMVL